MMSTIKHVVNSIDQRIRNNNASPIHNNQDCAGKPSITIKLQDFKQNTIDESKNQSKLNFLTRSQIKGKPNELS